jgi:hypothetical protein
MVRHTDPWVPCAQLQVSVWLLEQARNVFGRLDAMEADADAGVDGRPIVRVTLPGQRARW